MIKSAVSRQTAKSIMGGDMIDIEEMLKCFRVSFSGDEDFSQLADIPFSEELLYLSRETHLLFPGYPFTINDIQKVFPELLGLRGRAWYVNEDVATKEKVEYRWYLIRKDIVPGSWGSWRRTFEELEQLLKNKEEIPRACELVFMTILAKQARSIHLFLIPVCSRSLDHYGNPVRFCQRGGDEQSLDLWSWTDNALITSALFGVVPSWRV